MPTDLSQQPEPKANILLVDDSPANLLALEAVLDGLGHNLVKATSGEEALGLLADRDFAAVLLDVRMPGLDGFETAKLIRSRERSRHTPIIFLTAHEDNGPTVEQAYSLGAVDYLVKPLVPVVLRAKVRVFIDLFQKAEQVKHQAEGLRLLVQEAADREEELKAFHRDLEKLVRERTAALAASNEALQEEIVERRRAEESLREANRHKDDFLSMLAHELRNPLAPLMNGIHILRMSEANRKGVAEARGMMERQVKHLSRIVDDLLEVSRVTRGKLTLRPERLDLARLVRVTAEDHRHAFGQAGLGLELELPELPVWVQGDPTRLAQVLGNLLQNAVKFTERGGKAGVRVQVDEASQQAVLTVRDTGVGVEPDLLPRLFETFAQADRSLDRSQGGLGLGLALVKGLVELHGGEVHAASEGQGRGAEFTVRLPRQPEPAAITAMPAAPDRARKRLRVLVVEDNQDAADSLKMLLELFGYDVAVAYSGPAGVKTAEDWQPDVVLCDIGLPGMDGYAVAGALRRNPATAKVRMIAVTGYGGDDDRRRSQEAGFDAHLTKPADPAALQELVARPA